MHLWHGIRIQIWSRLGALDIDHQLVRHFLQALTILVGELPRLRIDYAKAPYDVAV